MSLPVLFPLDVQFFFHFISDLQKDQITSKYEKTNQKKETR